MSNKLILVLIDGLAWHVAQHAMGYLHALCEARQASVKPIQAALPTISRPLYECVLTGATPVESGILHNQVVRFSNQESIFHLARQANFSTAAAAYSWISELYNCAPYQATRDRYTNDESLAIQHGIFYHDDAYPDSHLYLDADYLAQRYQPDFLFVHPMNVDDAGHRGGGDSAVYRNTARLNDMHLSSHIPSWLAQGYQIIVTADHGMNNDYSHGGNLAHEREVPLFLIGERFNHEQLMSCPIQQTQIRDLCALVLGIPTPNSDILSVLLK